MLILAIGYLNLQDIPLNQPEGKPDIPDEQYTKYKKLMIQADDFTTSFKEVAQAYSQVAAEAVKANQDKLKELVKEFK